MILADNYTDSLLIYADWLEDNEQLTLATEIREELEEIYIHDWCNQFLHSSRVGCNLVNYSIGNNLVGFVYNLQSGVDPFPGQLNEVGGYYSLVGSILDY